MKVSKLIEALREFNPDALVAVECADTEDYGWLEAATDVVCTKRDVAIDNRLDLKAECVLIR